MNVCLPVGQALAVNGGVGARRTFVIPDARIWKQFQEYS